MKGLLEKPEPVDKCSDFIKPTYTPEDLTNISEFEIIKSEDMEVEMKIYQRYASNSNFKS